MLVFGELMRRRKKQLSVVQGKQRRAFERILDILEEKRDIREMIMDVEDRKRLLNERDELTDEDYVHVREWGGSFYRWMRRGKVDEMQFFRLNQQYRNLLEKEHRVRFGTRRVWDL